MLVHFYKLDPSRGIDFSKMVRSLHGLPVTSSSPDDARGFWLIAFFACSKLKLDETNVGLILQSVLGGFATDFAVVEVKDWIFKFTVSSKWLTQFDLWNERGCVCFPWNQFSLD